MGADEHTVLLHEVVSVSMPAGPGGLVPRTFQDRRMLSVLLYHHSYCIAVIAVDIYTGYFALRTL